jgi:hypothetical protein
VSNARANPIVNILFMYYSSRGSPAATQAL